MFLWFIFFPYFDIDLINRAVNRGVDRDAEVGFWIEQRGGKTLVR